MSCQFCQKAWFVEKLGRCQQCMWQANLGSLILLACCFSYGGEVAVYAVALWLAFAGFAGLSLAHWIMFFYYRWSTQQPPNK